MHKRNIVITTSLIIAMTLVAGCNRPESQTKVQDASDTPNSRAVIKTSTPIPTPSLERINLSKLQSEINDLIKAEQSKQESLVVGVALEDYLTNDTLEINADTTFDAASIGKLPILMLLYDQIKAGKISEEEVITITESNVERYGTGSIQYQKLPKDYSVKELARLMINVSDNTASSVLATRIGRNNLSEYVKGKGMTGTDTKENDTIPFDTLILLKELYQRYHNGEKEADTMITFLTDTAFEDRIPQRLPENLKVSHKIGTQAGQFHDAGIIFIPNRPIGLSIYTKNASNETGSKELIADISLAIYSHMSKLSSK